MILAVLFWIFISIARGVVASQNNISEIFDSHIWYILPDLLFFAYSCYWVFVKEKVRPNIYLGLYLLAFLGSIIWDYQYGYYALKLLFPFLLFLILHKDKVNLASIKDLVYMVITLFPPIFLMNALSNKNIEPPEVKEKEEYGLPWKIIILGFIVGLFMMLLLSVLDPEFAKFLRINDWLKYVRSSLFSGLYYLLAFSWFFWIPVRAQWKLEEERTHPLRVLLNLVALVVTSVLIGYTLYDSYIVLRALRVLNLTFESLGRNTQMSYLEMVFMSGMWLGLILYSAGKLLRHTEVSTNKIRTYIIALLVSMIWLLPPIGNILRVLLVEYIPQFGLTSLRLFGLHTASAFIVAVAATALSLFMKSKQTLSHGMLGFTLTLALFSFAFPNNLVMYDWHLNRLREGKELDYRYQEGIRLEKWGYLFTNKLGSDNKQDRLLLLNLAKQTKNKSLTETTQNKITEELKTEVIDIKNLLETQQFKEIKNRYLSPDKWVYTGEPIKDLTIKVTETKDPVLEDIHTFFEEKNEFYNATLGIEYIYKNRSFMSSTLVSFPKDTNRSYYLTLNDLSPLWISNIEYMNTICGNGISLIDPNNKPVDKQIPEYIIHRFFDPEGTCGSQYILPLKSP